MFSIAACVEQMQYVSENYDKTKMSVIFNKFTGINFHSLSVSTKENQHRFEISLGNKFSKPNVISSKS